MGKLLKTKLPNVGNSPQVDWYLIANRSEAVLFRKIRGEMLECIDRIENPEGRIHEMGLTSIHYEHVAHNFAHQLMRMLEKAKAKDRFDQLVIAAEPHFLGILKAYIPKNLKAELKASVPKEYNRFTNDVIQTRIGDWIKEHNYLS